ncbi:PAAR domain-containing protein [Rubrivirga sp. IMCC45206]|uniref:PAAR domain-containing protein n=1 Tax=Rubrivirga sp. IMCC45206 TaxID=3391614 RepID=UPI0039900C95
MPAPAARFGDPTAHGPALLGPGCPTVLIAGQPAWRVGDAHTCPMANAPPPAGPGTPHVTGVAMPSNPKVLIGGKPASRLGDQVMETAAVAPLPPPNVIASGVPTVLL